MSLFDPKAPKSIDRRPLVSSHILSGGYDPETKTLHLEFRGKDGAGKVFEYQNVPPEHGNGIFSAESHGKYFAANIRPFHPGKPLFTTEHQPGAVKLSDLQSEEQKAGAVGAIQRVLSQMAKT